jgi:hypothetical protein
MEIESVQGRSVPISCRDNIPRPWLRTANESRSAEGIQVELTNVACHALAVESLPAPRPRGSRTPSAASGRAQVVKTAASAQK